MPEEEENPCQVDVDPHQAVAKTTLSLLYQYKSLPALSVVIIVTSVVVKYLTEFKLILGLSSSLSWEEPIIFWSCFLLYSLGLIWVSALISHHLVPRSSSPAEPPTTLARLRSHLTFLPIIHLIRQRRPGFENTSLTATTAISRHGLGSDDLSLGVNPDDKDYLSKLEFQRDALIDAILDSYVFPWYERVSYDKTFPLESKRILQISFDRLSEKFRQMDRTSVAREAIEIFHYHWKTYLDAVRVGAPGLVGSLEPHFKYLHTCLESRENLSKHCEVLLSFLLKELLIPDLQSRLICQFLAGIIVKGFLLYYVDIISNPKWINSTIKNLLSSGTLNPSPPDPPISNGSSRESLCDMTSSCKCGCMDSSSHRESDSSIQTDTQPSSSKPSDADASASDRDIVLDGITHQDSVFTHEDREIGKNFSNGNKGGTEDGKSKRGATVSAALGGLLSTTALPLLPEGSSYNLQSLSALDGGGGQTSLEDSMVKDDDETHTEEVKELGSDEAVPFATESTELNAYTSVVHNMNRHLSLDGNPKFKSVLTEEKATTRSLDDTKANCSMLRQDEFDLSGDASLKPTAGYTAKSDISPTYDEAEDFAATIAKLRSLLEQRESRKNLHENLNLNDSNEQEVFNSAPNTEKAASEEPVTSSSVSQPQPMRRIADNMRPSLNSQSSASSLGSEGSVCSTNSQSSVDGEKHLQKIVDELEESGPQINRFFINVAIPKTESCSDSSGQFVLYSIQYEGVYIEENDDGQLEKLVLRTTTIKRRFQEFLTLQNHLEESPIWRPHVKGIKPPSKWLNLSFAKSESTTNAAQKKAMLERYLQQLCYHPVLGFCPHLRQFMAYGEEGFYAFVAPESIPLHRFDKIAKKFTGVFNTVRDALPSFESELLTVPTSPDMTTKSPTESKGRSLFASFLRAEKCSPVEKGDDSKTPSEISKRAERTGNDDSNSDSNENGKADQEDNNGDGGMEGLSGENTCTTSSTTLLEEPVVEGSMDAVYPLAVAATELLCDVLWLPHHRPHSASVSAFLSISGKSFENYIQDLLDLVLSQDAVLGYLEMATSAIKEWAKMDESAEFELEFPTTTEAELKNCLRQKIPVWVRWMWGRSRVDVTIDRLTKVCQDAQINQDLILSLMELLFSKLVDANVENETEKLI